MTDYLRWLEADREALWAALEAATGTGQSARKSAVSAMNLGATVNVANQDTQAQVDEHEIEIEELKKRKGLPAGPDDGYLAGHAVQTDPAGEPQWYPNLAGGVPTLYVVLEDGAPWYGWNQLTWLTTGSTDTGESGLPAVEFENNGKSMSLVSWNSPFNQGISWDQFPINYDIELRPHYDGEQFEVFIPSDGWGFGGLQNMNFNIRIYKEREHSAVLDFGSNDVAQTTAYRYPDSGIVPWEYNPNPGSPSYYWNRLVLPAGTDAETCWAVQWNRWQNIITPAIAIEKDDVGRDIAWPLDAFYWRHVQSRSVSKEISASGNLTPREESVPLVNDGTDARRVGLVRASVKAAPTGGPIEIVIRVDGNSITTTPITIPAGETTVAIEPNAYTHGPHGAHPTGPYSSMYLDSVLWFPGDGMTVEVPTVGSGDPGADLLIQVYYG
ncbi:hypothetical protein [Agromyces sp. NPDC058104]|uniref:hypothetical protein n=1 Tax=Agromyces sp. NPDC058104 TaxID=3346342 RepID=UPI0036D79AA1